MRRWLVVAVASVLMVLPACANDADPGAAESPSGADGTTSPSAAPTTEATSAPSDGPTPGGAPVIEVTDTGAEPRTELRLALEEGATARALMTMTMGFETTMDGQAGPPTPVPSLEMVIATTVARVTERGDATIEIVYEEVGLAEGSDVPPEVAAQLEDVFAQIAGVTGEVEVSDRGEFLAGGFQIPEDTAPEVRQMLEQFDTQLEAFTIPLPREALGRGAQWTVTTRPELMGMVTDMTVTYELARIDDEGYVVDVDIAQSAAPQEVAFPGMTEPGRVERLETQATGRTDQGFGALLPRTATSDGVTEARFVVHDPATDRDVVVEQRATMSMTLEPA